MEQIYDRLTEWGTLYGVRVVGALAILILGRIAVMIITKIVKNLLLRSSVEATLTRFLVSLTRIALIVFVVIAALGTLGVQTASLVAIIGAAGLAIGFALQGSLANFASGVILIFFRPFKRGDYVEGAGAEGVVEEIQIFNTILRTLDNKSVIVPNSKMTGDNIINYSAKEHRRVDLVFGISYGDDVKAAKSVLEQILAEHELVLKDPAPSVVVVELGDSSVNFGVRPWVKVADYWAVYFDITEKVKLALDKNGITIPFPQRDVHMHQVA